MNLVVENIPRLYTALAEWGACMVYILTLQKRAKGFKLAVAALIGLIVQSLYLTVTDNIPVVFWVPCMMGAVLLMYLFICTCCKISLIDAGYSCIKAFVAAEFVASLEWQIYYFFWPENDAAIIIELFLLFGVYVFIYGLLRGVEKKYIPEHQNLNMNKREMVSACIIGLTVFFMSNLSFVAIQTPFSGSNDMEVFNIRTMVDLGGLAILFAHYIQLCELRVRRELEAVQNVLKGHYAQYQQAKESIDIVNFKYHDFKHQIAVLRSEKDEVKWNAYLDELESDIKNYEAQNKTGNKVLDTVLTGKSIYCAQKNISLTCVADGNILEFMEVMDICSIFGNALENAIECEEKIKEEKKRLIHVSVSAQKNFVHIKVVNYFEGNLQFENSLPLSQKNNKEYHGYGMKSMLFTAKKYGGSLTTSVKGNWFELRILIPIPKVNIVD